MTKVHVRWNHACFLQIATRLARFGLHSAHNPMQPTTTTASTEPALGKPISVGLTCWRWQRSRVRNVVQLAQRLGVTVQLTQRIHGLRREIECQVSGANVDRFIGEFVRHC